MLTEELNYNLPKELIAQRPSARRGGSRLLVLNRTTGAISGGRFCDVEDLVAAGDCIVFNDTKVLAARFFGQRLSGAKIEGLYLRQYEDGQWLVMLKNASKVKIGEKIQLSKRDGQLYCYANAVGRDEDGQWFLDVDSGTEAVDVLGEIGIAPLPPYIKRDREGDLTESDLERYQTIYAKNAGAVAAPTAGLHFTAELLGAIANKGVKLAYTTLHVGAGTFKPVEAAQLDDHKMHAEQYRIDEQNAELINNTREAGGRIIATGTTTVRVLESVFGDGRVHGGQGETKLFIQPGYEFGAVDAMITNFHLPKSTLLALVGAFAGMDNVRKAYREAIEKQYRFYSYGDAMMII